GVCDYRTFGFTRRFGFLSLLRALPPARLPLTEVRAAGTHCCFASTTARLAAPLLRAAGYRLGTTRRHKAQDSFHDDDDTAPRSEGRSIPWPSNGTHR